MANKELSEAGYARAVAREGKQLEVMARYERKAFFWLGKLVAARATAKRLRKRIEEAEEAKRASQAATRAERRQRPRGQA